MYLCLLFHPEQKPEYPRERLRTFHDKYFHIFASYLQLFLSSSPTPISSAARKMSRNRYDRKHSHTAPPTISSTDITHRKQFGLRLLHLIPLTSDLTYSLFLSPKSVTVQDCKKFFETCHKSRADCVIYSRCGKSPYRKEDVK